MNRSTLILLFLTVVSVLSACPFCSGGTNEKSLDAYLGSALSLSTFPILLMAIGFFVFRHLKKKYAVTE